MMRQISLLLSINGLGKALIYLDDKEWSGIRNQDAILMSVYFTWSISHSELTGFYVFMGENL